MDAIKRMALEFGEDLENLGYTFEKVNDAISDKLLNIYKSKEKLRFLAYLKDIAETQYQKHAHVCTSPENCGTNDSLENALYAINQQYDEIAEIEDGVVRDEKPAMMFFEDGQYFDAFSAIRELIKKAQKSIIMIDAYVSADTLTSLPAKDPSISLKILTDKKSRSKELSRAIEVYKKQYDNIEIAYSKKFHDRFLIIDDDYFYHIGASLKDVGNKAFMFTEITDFDIKQAIRKKFNAEWEIEYNIAY